MYKRQNQCSEQTFTLLCNTECEANTIRNCFKALGRHIGHIGWVNVKITLQITLVNPQNNYKHPIKILYLEDSLQLPNGLDGASLNVLIMDFVFIDALSQMLSLIHIRCV